MDNTNEIATGEPIKDFPMQFTWQTGDWKLLFDKQIELIKNDILRAKVQDKIIVYLSCPISSRGGGYSATNVEIAEYTKTRLYQEWGTGFWILNPASYQMESKAGTGLMHQHARDLWGDEGEQRLKKLYADSPPIGGDYMRMWTTVLVSDNAKDDKKNLAGDFDMFYFLGPSDVRKFFINEGGSSSVTGGIYGYFSRKLSFDFDFMNTYRTTDKKQWQSLRNDFFEFYAAKGSVSFSLGSHDEWNILVTVNKLRMEKYLIPGSKKGNKPWMDLGFLLPGFFDGHQIQPGALFTRVLPGYEAVKINNK